MASAGPNGVSNQPQAISSPSPARANSPGLIASQRRKRSCSRDDPERPAAWAVSSTLCRSASSRLAWSSARYCWYRFGLTPTHWLNTRWKCAGLNPTLAATSSSDACSGARAAIASMARPITA